MRHTILTVSAVLIGATAVLAHQGVKDPGVMARMDGMKQVGKAMSVLGDMAKGKAAFDADAAAAAKTAALEHLARVPELFKEPHDDPKSEALPVIWTDFDSFLDRNRASIRAVEALDLTGLDGLRSTLSAAGKGCSGCHKDFRQD